MKKYQVIVVDKKSKVPVVYNFKSVEEAIKTYTTFSSNKNVKVQLKGVSIAHR